MAQLSRRHIAEHHGLDSEAMYAMVFRLTGAAVASEEVRANDPESPALTDWNTWFEVFWRGKLSPRRSLGEDREEAP
jgi:hypothetical protein